MIRDYIKSQFADQLDPCHIIFMEKPCDTWFYQKLIWSSKPTLCKLINPKFTYSAPIIFFQVKAIRSTTQVTLTLNQNPLVTRDYIKSQFADQLDRH